MRAVPPGSLLVVLLACALGCGSGDEGPGGKGQALLCAQETRADAFVAGLTRRSAEGRFVLSLDSVRVEGVSGAPDRGLNVWTVTVRDEAGAPLPGLTLRLRGWMPDHGHGTTPSTFTAAPAAAPGTHEFGPFNLFMTGFWEFTFSAEVDGTPDQAKLGFCLEG
jgi:hypothetical protein